MLCWKSPLSQKQGYFVKAKHDDKKSKNMLIISKNGTIKIE